MLSVGYWHLDIITDFHSYGTAWVGAPALSELLLLHDIYFEDFSNLEYHAGVSQCSSDFQTGLNSTVSVNAVSKQFQQPRSIAAKQILGQQQVHQAPQQRSSQENKVVQMEPSRPEDTLPDVGNYSCTYHGCAQRFETLVELQKHKRESHRQAVPRSYVGVRDGGYIEANAHATRNSQAGPHRCQRSNPSTGKPCNSMFSRPYDLTRHEDTIHNARMYRCHLCAEKAFSRKDGLARHMRVVHPEIDWLGMMKRRYGCHLCAKKAFSRKDGLARHMRVVHPEIDWLSTVKSAFP